jgi:hypothetical protein
MFHPLCPTPSLPLKPPPDTTLSELNASLLREEEGLVPKRGLVTTYSGGGGGPLGGSAQLNDGQAFTLHITDVRSWARSCLRALLPAQLAWGGGRLPLGNECALWRDS